VHEDTFAKEVDRYRYWFRVPAGELTIEVPVTVAKNIPDRDRKAVEEAYAVARGKSAARGRVREIGLGTTVSRDWEKKPTLRQFRERYQRRLK
jgi:hypothetical protein